MPKSKIIILVAILTLLSTEGFTCSCRRAWRNSFLSNISRFDVVARGTIERSDSENGWGTPYLNIAKLYKGKVNDSIIQLVDGGLDCRHMWIAESGVQIIVGLGKEHHNDNQIGEQYYGAGCITSVLVLSEDDRLVTNSKCIDYAGQVREPRVSWLCRKMKLRRFERRIHLRTLFHKPEIRKKS